MTSSFYNNFPCFLSVYVFVLFFFQNLPFSPFRPPLLPSPLPHTHTHTFLSLSLSLSICLSIYLSLSISLSLALSLCLSLALYLSQTKLHKGTRPFLSSRTFNITSFEHTLLFSKTIFVSISRNGKHNDGVVILSFAWKRFILHVFSQVTFQIHVYSSLPPPPPFFFLRGKIY